MEFNLIDFVQQFDTAGLGLVELLVAVGALVSTSTAAVAALQVVVRGLDKLADLTTTEVDNAALEGLGMCLDKVAGGLRFTGRALGRTSILKPGDR